MGPDPPRFAAAKGVRGARGGPPTPGSGPTPGTLIPPARPAQTCVYALQLMMRVDRYELPL
jgi:hypothetical protein